MEGKSGPGFHISLKRNYASFVRCRVVTFSVIEKENKLIFLFSLLFKSEEFSTFIGTGFSLHSYSF